MRTARTIAWITALFLLALRAQADGWKIQVTSSGQVPAMSVEFVATQLCRGLWVSDSGNDWRVSVDVVSAPADIATWTLTTQIECLGGFYGESTVQMLEVTR